MYQRLCQLPERQSCLLLGPRQTGKSTLVKGILPADAFTVDLLPRDNFLRYARDPRLFRAEIEEKIRSGVRVFFVDEIQKLPELLDEAQSLLDTHRVRFLLTGSSARKLRRGGANLLAGRAIVRHLHPLTRRELGAAFDLRSALRYGTLPPAVDAQPAAAREFLASYADTYLREEVQAEALVRNLGGFARFLDIAAAQSGEILNASAVSRDAALAARTVQEYFQILEDTLIGFRLEPWRKSPRARMVGHPRFYLFDTGVTNALCGRLGADPDSVLAGKLFEQWLVCECRAMVDYLYPETRLYYWRTNVGTEVDLLFERHGKLRVAVEIMAKRRIAGADLAGLRAFADLHPGVPRAVVCMVSEPYRIDEIEILPLHHFLERLDRWL